MLWLILGIILLVIAIAGGVIVHPVIFALAILALRHVRDAHATAEIRIQSRERRMAGKAQRKAGDG